ncbi:hypothetical protein D3C71_1895920 [compost metagenome]
MLSSCESSSASVKPMMAFMGVRISWLMFARNVLRAAAACSARSLAVRRSCSIALRWLRSEANLITLETLPSASKMGL